MKTLDVSILLLVAVSSHGFDDTCRLARAGFDGNGVVNFLDIAEFGFCFLVDPAQTPSCRFSDLNNDAAINFIDYSVVSANSLNEVPSNRPAPWLQSRGVSLGPSSDALQYWFDMVDIDEDGRKDLLSLEGFNVKVTLNSPNGLMFDQIQPYSVGTAPLETPVIADFNDSCTLDVVNVKDDRLFFNSRPYVPD